MALIGRAVADSEQSDGIMAVLVLYGRSPMTAASWPTLLEWLQGATPPLRHCLIYDNSPDPTAGAALLPNRTSLVWEPENRGTASAYQTAAAIAVRHGCDRLLLLDQDTALPADYLALAAVAANAAPQSAALLPRVYHGMHLVSPAIITAWGSVRATANPVCEQGITTAISSGAIVRCDEIAKISFPVAIWLDYVDHWMFHKIANGSSSIGLINVDLPHDLSVRTPESLSPARVRTILAAEDAFYRVLRRSARVVLPVRRVLRAFRYAVAGRLDLAGIVLRAVIAKTAARL